jgi:integrase
LLLFALHTGARAGEQRAIEWSDIDWRSRSVRFRRAMVLGKVGPTKSGRERSVPLTVALEAALKSIRHLRGQLVFCNPDGSPLTLWQLHDRFQFVCRRAGLRRIRWHDMRHSFASQLVIAGVPIRQVQEWLGHQSITMTMRLLTPGSEWRNGAHPSTRLGCQRTRSRQPDGNRIVAPPESALSTLIY